MLSSDPFDVAVGERLKAVREKARLLQPEFAEKLGVSPRAYANYERGERTLPAQAIKALHDQFGVDPIWLLSGPGADPHKPLSRLDLLRDIIIKVENHLTKHRLRLAPEKKARLVILLYQYLQLKDSVEDQDIEHSLAVSSL